MADVNEIKFSGTVEKMQAVTTKTGTSMTRWLLKVGQNRFKCVAFKNLADAMLQCNDGDRISVTGTGSINSWKDDKDHWHNDFQVTAWSVENDRQKINYDKANIAKHEQQPATQPQQQR